MTDAATTATTNAWRQTRYGGPEVVESTRVAIPVPGKGEVLVRVQAASLPVAALAATRRLRPVIEREVPLSDARDALAHVDAGHTVGKVVVIA
jgi:NADPH:quinone reductase-like Zn-dependent oxidoreductase